MKPTRSEHERRHFKKDPPPRFKVYKGDRGPHVIPDGVLRKSGGAKCGRCLRRVNRIKGGKRRRKSEGWRYTLALGWLCERCSDALRPRSAPPVYQTGPKKGQPKPVFRRFAPPDVENPELSTRSGPQSLGDSRTPDEAEERVAKLPQMSRAGSVIPSAKLRKMRRRARQKERKAAGAGDVHTAVRHDQMSSTDWIEWKRRRRRS